jgi:ABC-type phosphate transport system substrate-binding protein
MLAQSLRVHFVLLLLAIGGLAVTSAGQAQAPGPDIAVVVNPANSVDNLSHSELRKIFAGERRSWAGGVTVRILVRSPNTRERDALLRLLQMAESDYEQYWTTKIFRGEAQSAPLVLPSVGMTREAILAYPGAIALVAANDVKPGMKVIKIDSRLPNESGYPLH